PHFFFCCYCVHRSLHSFPTRRSSDLAQHVGGFIGARPDVPLLEFLLEMYFIHSDMLLPWCSHAALRAAGIFAGKGTDFNARNKRDRKSTRLNSSHVKISYAVFCLKKK